MERGGKISSMPARESHQAPGKLSVGPLSANDAAAVRFLAEAATATDQVAPLSEVPLLNLRADKTWLTHLVMREDEAGDRAVGNVVGYAQVDRSGKHPVAEIVVHPDFRRRGIGAQLLRTSEQDARILPAPNRSGLHNPPQLRVWAHGNTAPAQSFAARHGYVVVRELLQLARPLLDDNQGPNPFVSTWRRSAGLTPANAASAVGAASARRPAPAEQSEPSDNDLPTQALPMQSMAAISRARAVRSRAPRRGAALGQRQQPTAFIPPRERQAPPSSSSGSGSADSQGYRLRAFEPGSDDAAWVALNASIFASHPEQGHLDLADFQTRVAEPWFDPNGFLVLETDEGALAAFCWTKVPAGLEVTAGEIYAIGVGANHRKRGLAAFLLEAGFSHLANKGLSSVMLYVESDNEAALTTYRKVGFMPHSSDVQYAKLPKGLRQ